MENNAVMRSQSYAVEIEHILRKIFDCERFGFGGVVNSDYIRKQPIPAMLCGLSFIYATSTNEKKKKIEDFIDTHMFYKEMSIDYLLSFETNSKSDGLTTTEICAENGEKELNNIIEAYREVVKL